MLFKASNRLQTGALTHRFPGTVPAVDRVASRRRVCVRAYNNAFTSLLIVPQRIAEVIGSRFFQNVIFILSLRHHVHSIAQAIYAQPVVGSIADGGFEFDAAKTIGLLSSAIAAFLGYQLQQQVREGAIGEKTRILS